MNDIDHEYTDNVVCPYCGHEQEPHEFENGDVFTEDEVRLECPDCEKEFASCCNISYSFSTHEVDVEAEKHARAEQLREAQERRDKHRAAAAAWLPGTRVRVRADTHYIDFIRGREGVVPNKELNSHGQVNVTLDATPEHKAYNTVFDPKDLERL